MADVANKLKELLEAMRAIGADVKVHECQDAQRLGREPALYHDIYMAANEVSAKVFVIEMANAKSVQSAYIDAIPYIGRDKDKLKSAIGKFKKIIKQATDHLESIIEDWDESVKAASEDDA